MHSDSDPQTNGPTPGECVLLGDGEGTIVWSDPVVADVLGREETDVTGTTVESLLGPSVPDPPQRGTAPITETVAVPVGDTVHDVTVTVDTIDVPGTTSVYRCRRTLDEQLGLFDVLSRIADGVVAFDTEWRYTYANETAEELLGRSSAELLGEVIWDLFPKTAGTDVEREFRRVMAIQEPSTLERYSNSLDRWVEIRVFPSPTGASVYFRDISARKARERQLQRERDLTEQLLRVSPMGIAVHTPDGRFVRVNERAEEILGVEPGELVGEELVEPEWESYGPDGEPFPDEAFPFNVVLRTGEPTFGTEMTIERRDDTRIWLSVSAAPLLDTDGDIERVVVGFEEITERKRYERQLKESERQFRAVFEGTLDALILADDDGDYLEVNAAACELFGLEEDELTGRNVADFAPEGYDVAAAWDAFLETGTLQGEFPLIRPDGETRVTDYVATANVTPGLHLSALRDITERKADEKQLAAQRDELRRLDELNELIRGVHRAIAGTTDRETIERAVCDGLVRSDSYPVAVTARRTATRAMQVEHAAGLPADALAALRDGDTPCFEGTAARAIAANEVTVLSALDTDGVHPALSDLVADHGLHTIGTIPIEYDGVVYGVLCVGSIHEGAFNGRERDVFAELGQLLGKAIEAIQTKKLLYATAVLELELSVSADVEPLAALNARVGGRWELDGVVPVEGSRYLLYVDVGDSSLDEVEAAAAGVAGLDRFRRIETGTDRLLELRVGHDTPVSALLDAGGRIRDGTVEHGTSRFVVDVTLDTDVRDYIDRVEQRAVAVDLLAKREVDRTTPRAWTGADSDMGLTTRQRTVLEAAYYSGYFDWPRRRTTGAELADSLGIASSTLHQHLRVASAKVFEQYFQSAVSA